MDDTIGGAVMRPYHDDELNLFVYNDDREFIPNTLIDDYITFVQRWSNNIIYIEPDNLFNRIAGMIAMGALLRSFEVTIHGK